MRRVLVFLNPVWWLNPAFILCANCSMITCGDHTAMVYEQGYSYSSQAIFTSGLESIDDSTMIDPRCIPHHPRSSTPVTLS